MGLRPAHCYHNPDKDRPYTRYAVTVPRKNYIGAVPGLKTRQFNMGNSTKAYDRIVNLICDERVMIRDNAIESVRMQLNRKLTKVAGKDSFFIKVRMYPFHILRENKQAQGAHADRIQTGMSHPFGKAIGRAVRAKKGQIILSVLCMEEKSEEIKKMLDKAKNKLPCDVKVTLSNDVKSIGSLPRARKLQMEEEKEATAAAAVAAAKPAATAEAGKEAAPKEAGKEEKGKTGAKPAAGKEAAPKKEEKGKEQAKGKEAKPAEKKK